MIQQISLAQSHNAKTKYHYLEAMINIRSGEVSSEDETAIKYYVNALELTITLLTEKRGEHDNAHNIQ